MATIESIQTSLRIADDWDKKGQPTWVLKCLSSSLMGYLQLAVNEQPDAESGIDWLIHHNFREILSRYFATLKTVDAEVRLARLPSSVVAGNYYPLVYAHAAWCLNQIGLGESFATFAEREDIGELGTPFWREYARGLGSLIRQEEYHAKALRLRGQEKYWMTYIRLIEAASKRQPIKDAVAAIDEQFATRNRDTTIRDDAYRIEGSGGDPVKWDLRRHGLLNYLAAQR